jgi:hypothetical protein
MTRREVIIVMAALVVACAAFAAGSQTHPLERWDINPSCFVSYNGKGTMFLADTGTFDGDEECVEELLRWQEWHGGPPLDPACAERVVRECGVTDEGE